MSRFLELNKASVTYFIPIIIRYSFPNFLHNKWDIIVIDYIPLHIEILILAQRRFREFYLYFRVTAEAVVGEHERRAEARVLVLERHVDDLGELPYPLHKAAERLYSVRAYDNRLRVVQVLYLLFQAVEVVQCYIVAEVVLVLYSRANRRCEHKRILSALHAVDLIYVALHGEIDVVNLQGGLEYPVCQLSVV